MTGPPLLSPLAVAISLVSIWLLLGLFLDPQGTAAFAVAAPALIYHCVSLFYNQIDYFRQLKNSLKEKMMAFEKENTIMGV